MTFDKPTFIKPDSATIGNLNYWDIHQGGLKIGTMMKEKGMIYLDVMYNKYEFKESEKLQIMTVIEIEYTKAFFHVVGSVKDCKIEELKSKLDELNKTALDKWLPIWKDKVRNDLKIEG